MSAKSPDNTRIELGASRALAAVLVLLHGGALVIAMSVPLNSPTRVALIILVIASLYRALGLHALRRTGGAITAFMLRDDDTCAVRRRGWEEWRESRLLDRWVHPWVTILIVREEGRRWTSSIVIPADAVAAEAFRRLRVRLRLRSAAA